MRDIEQLRLAPDGELSAESEWASADSRPAPLAGFTEVETGVISGVVSGRVKWFDVVRGFGFAIADGAGDDILLHYNLLTPHGRKSLPEGARVTATVCEGKRGRMASEILSFDLASAVACDPEQPSRSATARLDPIDFLNAAGDFAAVQVRWFNRSKGYGFLLATDGVTEIFIHMETVRRAGLEALQPGQSLRARIAQGPRGPLAVQVEEDESVHG